MLPIRWWTGCAIAVAVMALLGSYPFVQHGLRGAYFRSDNWSGDVTTRVDPLPSDVGVGLALGPGPPNHLSVSWIASLVVDDDDTYQLRVTTTARCRLTVDSLLAVDSRVAGIPTVALKPGVYTLAIQCAADDGKLRLIVWWDRANVDPRPISTAVLFPAPVTLEKARTVAAIERAQSWLLWWAMAAALLLGVDWAIGRGLFGWLVVAASAAVTAAVHLDWPPWLRGPDAAVWQWGYRTGPFMRPLFWAVASAVVVLAVIGATATSMARRAPRRAAVVLLVLGVAAGFAFQLTLLDAAPGGWRQSLIMGAWSTIGFLRAAALLDATPVATVMRDYPAIMPRLTFKATTHPPGGPLLFRALMSAARRAGVRGIVPNPVFGPPTTMSAVPVASVALIGALIWAVSASLTVLPIALAAWTLSRDPLQAAVVGLLWVFCPSPTIMTPSLDQLQTLLVASSFALMLVAQSARTWLLPAGAAGAIGGVALFFSFGTAPMLATGMLMACVWCDSPAGRQRYAVTVAAWVAGAVLAILVPVLVYGFPPLATLLQGLHAHRAFTVTRDYGVWLRYNLLDYAIWLGAATLVALGATLTRRRSAAWRLAVLACCGLLIGDLSGTARGEVGRLWMPFMPLMFAAAWTPAALKAPRDGVVAGAALAACCLVLSLHWDLWFFLLD